MTWRTRRLISKIRDYAYTLVGTTVYSKGSPLIATSQIDMLGFGNVLMLRERSLGTVLNERNTMLLAYTEDVLVSTLNSITKLESSLGTEQSCSGH